MSTWTTKTDWSDSRKYPIPLAFWLYVRVEKDGLPIVDQTTSDHPPICDLDQSRSRFHNLFYTKPQTHTSTDISFANASADGSEIAFIQNGKLNIIIPETPKPNKSSVIFNFLVPYTFTKILTWTNGAKTWNYFTARGICLSIQTDQRVESNGDNMAVYTNNNFIFCRK